MYSCSRQLKIVKNSAYYESYNKYLLSVINDTVLFEFAQFGVVDNSVYPILDSVILLSERCQYFDDKVKYLNSFRFGFMSSNDKQLYSIDAHLSPAQAIGLVLLETGAIQKINNIGAFYYRNYLFVIPTSNLGQQTEYKYFPFVKKTDSTLKIRAPKFFNEKVYSSYITFTKQGSSYKIKENKICGDEILIK